MSRCSFHAEHFGRVERSRCERLFVGHSKFTNPTRAPAYSSRNPVYTASEPISMRAPALYAFSPFRKIPLNVIAQVPWRRRKLVDIIGILDVVLIVIDGGTYQIFFRTIPDGVVHPCRLACSSVSHPPGWHRARRPGRKSESLLYRPAAWAFDNRFSSW